MYGMMTMEAIPKFDIKSVIKSDIKFDIRTKLTIDFGVGKFMVKKFMVE